MRMYLPLDFQHVGLKRSWDFDRDVAESTKNVGPQKYEELPGSSLF